MAYVDLNDVRLYYTEDGRTDAPALVFTHSLGTSADLWARQIPALAPYFRIIRYDTRGHGLSSLPLGDYSFAALADDLTGLLDHLGIAKAHLCGTSMGGMTVMQAALKRPDLVDRLILCNTAARIGSVESWSARIALVAEQGLGPLAPSLISRWVAEDFLRTDPDHGQMLCDMLRRTADAGYMGNCAALRDGDLRAEMAAITAPALVISGTLDLAVSPEQANGLAASLTKSHHVRMAVAHTSNWEQPETFNQILLRFLT